MVPAQLVYPGSEAATSKDIFLSTLNSQHFYLFTYLVSC